jgi:hypothetical protein
MGMANVWVNVYNSGFYAVASMTLKQLVLKPLYLRFIPSVGSKYQERYLNVRFMGIDTVHMYRVAPV